MNRRTRVRVPLVALIDKRDQPATGGGLSFPIVRPLFLPVSLRIGSRIVIKRGGKTEPCTVMNIPWSAFCNVVAEDGSFYTVKLSKSGNGKAVEELKPSYTGPSVCSLESYDPLAVCDT